MRVPRFHVPALVPEDAVVDLPGDAAHHAIHVLRLRAGAPVRVFDGSGNELEGRIERLGRRSVRVRLGRRLPSDAAPALRIVLAAAPLRGDLFDLVVQKATELGVSCIWPVVTTHTEAGGRALLSGTRLERWRKVASSAAAQCGRATVPEVECPSPLPDVLGRSFEGLRIFCYETAEKDSPFPLLEHAPAAVQLLVGPVGGWTPDEARLVVEERGYLPVSLGPRVLRAETAALTAVAAAQLLWGDLRPAPRPT